MSTKSTKSKNLLDPDEKLSLNILRLSFRISNKIIETMMANPRHGDVAFQIILFFLKKGTTTLEGILLLYKQHLPHEAQVLVRVIFELNVTFEAFVRLLRKDPQGACDRFRDSVMLEKIKQAGTSNLMGPEFVPDALTQDVLSANGQEIAERYDPQELEKIKKNGFSGLNVEQRARQADQTKYYNLVYRNFSRNTHSTDFIEHLHMISNTNASMIKTTYPTLARNMVAYDVTFMSSIGITTMVEDIYHYGFDVKLRRLKARRDKLRT